MLVLRRDDLRRLLCDYRGSRPFIRLLRRCRLGGSYRRLATAVAAQGKHLRDRPTVSLYRGERGLEGRMVKIDNLDKSPRSGWVLFGFCATAAYIVLFGLILANSGPDSIIPINKQTLALNTFGDFVAGLCAPLAFLWLFVATMVQSQELALQRQELRLTRVVANQQAEEARSQAQFIGEQTRILQAAETDKLVEVQVEAFLRRCFEISGSPIHIRFDGRKEKTVYFNSEPKNGLRVLRLVMGRGTTEMRKALSSRNDARFTFDRPLLVELQTRLADIQKALPSASARTRAQLQQDGFYNIVDDVDFWVENVTQQPEIKRFGDLPEG